MLNYVSERCWIDCASLYVTKVNSDVTLVDRSKSFFIYKKKLIVILVGILPLNHALGSGEHISAGAGVPRAPHAAG